MAIVVARDDDDVELRFLWHLMPISFAGRDTFASKRSLAEPRTAHDRQCSVSQVKLERYRVTGLTAL
jgi:hypothetical protein